MKNIIKLIVGDSEKEIRIDLFLTNKKKELSRTRVKNLILNEKLKIISGSIGYNGFIVNTLNPINKEGLILLNQNYHALWRAFLNNEEVEVILVNDGIMGVKIPPFFSGELSFSFNSPKTKLMVYISLASYLILGFVLLFKNRYK